MVNKNQLPEGSLLVARLYNSEIVGAPEWWQIDLHLPGRSIRWQMTLAWNYEDEPPSITRAYAALQSGQLRGVEELPALL